MQTGVRNPNLRADLADREFAFDAIHAAIARATDTVGELTGKRLVHITESLFLYSFAA